MTVFAALSRITFMRYLALVLLCLALFLPAQSSLPPFDRDEARFAQSSHQMVETGDYIDIRLQDDVRYKKPIGIYWLQSLSAKIVGATDQIWAYRIPSWLGAMGAVLLTAGLMARLFGARAGVLAAAFLATSLLLNVEARMAKTDACLLFSITLAQLVLARLWMERRLSFIATLLFWFALGLGVLIKGPLILLVIGLTIIALSVTCKSGMWLKPLLRWQGMALLLLMVLPWLVAITIKSEGRFWIDSVGKDLLSKAAAGQENHGAPFGYYMATVFATLWPWAPLLIPALVFAWKKRTEPAVQFCLAWALPFWVLFESLPTKLLHYTLPTFPALVGLMAYVLTAASGQVSRKVWILAFILQGVLLGAVALAIPFLPAAAYFVMHEAMPAFVSWRDIPVSALGLASSLFLLAAAVVAAGMAGQKRKIALLIIATGLVNFYAMTFSDVLAKSDVLWVSRSIDQLVAPYRPACPAPVTILGYAEPSVVFLLGTKTQLPADWQAVTLPFSQCQLVLVEQRLAATMPQDFSSHAETLGKVDGYNYSKGDAVSLTLYRLNP